MTPLPSPAPNLLRAFEAVYLLNLPERTDRLRDSFATLAQLDPRASSLVEVVPGVRQTEAGEFPSIGAHGCFLAHLGALRLARDRGAASVLIFEDDLRMEAAMRADWAAVAGALPAAQWDLINFGFHPRSNRTSMANASEEPLGALFATDEPLEMAHCYAVSRAALPPLIAYLETILTRPEGHPRGGPMHYDGALYHFFLEHPGTTRLRTAQSLVGQRSSRSDIAGARWFDRDLPLVRSAVSGVRRAMERFR